jgi:putative MATE family efflux protein
MHAPNTLTEGSINLRLLQLALPTLYANMLQSLNASINSFWVGRYLGETALAAISNANTVFILLISSALGISGAATILVGQAIGAGHLSEAKRIVGTGVTSFSVLSVIVAALGLMLCRPLLVALQTPAAALPFAMLYLRVVFLAVPGIFVYAFVIGILRGAGDARTPFYFLLLSVVLDIVLNPLFIFGLGPLPKLGIAGSAIAALIGQTASLVLLMRYLYRRRHVLCLHQEELRFLRLDRALIATLLKKGIPLGAQSLVFTLSGVLMIALVNRFGVETTAAFAAAGQVWVYLFMPALAINIAVSAMSAQNVGAGKWERVQSIARVGVIYSLLLTGAVVLLIEASSPRAFGLFLPAGSAALTIAAHLDRIVVWMFLFQAVALALSGVVVAAGHVVVPTGILAVSLLIVRFQLAEALLGRFQADAIWWSFPISSALAALLAAFYYKQGSWRSELPHTPQASRDSASRKAY